MRYYIFIILITALILSCKQAEEVVPEAEEQAIPVSLIIMERSNQLTKIDLFGRLYPKRDIQVFAGLDGEIIKLNYGEGEQVAKDDVLARIKRNIPGTDYAPFELKSPIEGTIMQVLFEEGATVSARNVIFQVADLSCIYFRGQVFGSDRGKVKNGQTMIIEESLSGVKLGLLVTKISPLIDEITGGVTIEAQVCFTGGATVKPGQSVDGYIITGTMSGFFVPRESVVKIGDLEGVYIIEEGRTRFKEVEILFRNDDYFLAEGLENGEEIVGEGAQLVEEGDLVKVVGE